MEIFNIITAVCVLTYIALIVYFIKGWNRLSYPKQEEIRRCEIPLTVVVAFRNEEKHLHSLIKSLVLQNYPNNQYSVILVNDDSDDGSEKIVQEEIKAYPHFRLINNKGVGKKEAIATAMDLVSTKYVVMTDADCLLKTDWLVSIAMGIHKEDPDLLVGPVRLVNANSTLKRFQVIDFLSLVTCGAGAIGMNNAIMCNGANLIVKKQVWQEVRQHLNHKYLSGDDVFLLHYCKAQQKKISFLLNSSAIVDTYPAESLKDLFFQRIRWTSKSKAYKDRFSLFVAWLVFITNLLLSVLLVGLVFWPKTLGYAFILALLGKGIIDYILLRKGASFFHIQLPKLAFVLFSLCYPLYTSVIVLLSVLNITKWKGRALSQN